MHTGFSFLQPNGDLFLVYYDANSYLHYGYDTWLY